MGIICSGDRGRSHSPRSNAQWEEEDAELRAIVNNFQARQEMAKASNGNDRSLPQRSCSSDVPSSTCRELQPESCDAAGSDAPAVGNSAEKLAKRAAGPVCCHGFLALLWRSAEVRLDAAPDGRSAAPSLQGSSLQPASSAQESSSNAIQTIFCLPAHVCQFLTSPRESTVQESYGQLLQMSRSSSPGPAATRQKSAATNSNHVSDYCWLLELLEIVVNGSAVDVAYRDVDRGQRATPLFVVAGACPNTFCGMQAVLYCKFGRDVDFWWIKPKDVDPDKLEWNTVNFHEDGLYKNVAESSRAIYAPLAQKFAGETNGSITFGVDEAGRAFIEEVASGQKTRMLVYFIWQEDWSSMVSWSNYVKGKICYQRGSSFYARQYEFTDAQLLIAPRDTEDELPSLFPPDSLQEMCEVTTWMAM